MKGNNLLSLKNIYKFLLNADYPSFSDAIIPADDKRGLTVVNFWQDIIVTPFKSGKSGKKIWRSEGGRNRYTSEIINKSEIIPIFDLYVSEICNAASKENIAAQVESFSKFLKSHNYRYNVFSGKKEAFIAMLRAEDPNFSQELFNIFGKVFAKEEMFVERGERGKLFYTAYFLTMLELMSFLNDAEYSNEVKALLSYEGLKPERIWEYIHEGYILTGAPMIFLTNKNSELNATPLKYNHFYGREEELFLLKNKLNRNSKCLISAIGGMGKTELLRQFLRCCKEDGLADYVATIQYEESLAISFANSFTCIKSHSPQESLNEAIDYINNLERKKVVILIDNMNVYANEDPDLNRLQDINAAIFISSRSLSLEGFESYELKPLSDYAGRLIFADNYGKLLSEEDDIELDRLLKGTPWRHALSLKLQARTAGKMGWNVATLIDKLGNDKWNFTYRDEDSQPAISQMFKAMFENSEVLDKYTDFMKCFSLLPYRGYSRDFVENSLGPFVVGDETIDRCLSVMLRQGWLEDKDGLYSMHPLIAESIEGLYQNKKLINDFIKVLYGNFKKHDGIDRQLAEGALLIVTVANKDVDALEVDTLSNIFHCINIIGIYYLYRPESRSFMRKLKECGKDCSSIGYRILEHYDLLSDMTGRSEDYLDSLSKDIDNNIAETAHFDLTDLGNDAGSNENIYMATFKTTIAECYFESFCFEKAIKAAMEGEKLAEYLSVRLSAAVVKFTSMIALGYDEKEIIKGIDEIMLKYADKNVTGDTLYATLLMLRIMCHTRLNQVEEAQKYYGALTECLKDYTGATADFTIAMAKAQILAIGGDFDSAADEMERAIRSEHEVRQNGATLAIAHLFYADILRKAGRGKEALRELKLGQINKSLKLVVRETIKRSKQ